MTLPVKVLDIIAFTFTFVVLEHTRVFIHKSSVVDSCNHFESFGCTSMKFHTGVVDGIGVPL